jgi:dipeptidyl aminopeptidase/acylaminoacyl peptidase
MHGLSDRRVDPRHTRRFTEALEAQDVPVTTILVDGGSHAGLIAGFAAPLQFTNDTLQQVLDFLSQLQAS